MKYVEQIVGRRVTLQPVQLLFRTMKRWSYWLFAIVQFYSIMASATLLRIDLEKRLLKKPNRWLILYVIAGNLIFLCLLPHAILVNMSHVQLYAANPIATYANYATIFIRLVIMSSSVLTRPKRDAELGKWLETMMQIQIAYFDRFKDIPRRTAHRKWLYLNIAIAFFHIYGSVADMHEALAGGHIFDFLDMYPLYGMIAFQHLLMLHHAALLCYLRESFSVINHQLLINRMDPKLSLIYSQLCLMMERLNVIYSPMMLCIQLGHIISNSMVGYIGLLMLMQPEKSSYGYLFGSVLYLCLLVHMYLYFMVCDWVISTAKETEIIVFECTTLSMDQEIEKLSLCYSLHKRRINISGMFNINLSTLFSITAQTVLYTIILIQIDFGNLSE